MTPQREITFLTLVNALLRRRRMIVFGTLAVGTVGLILALVRPPQYAAESTFVPRSTQQGGDGLAGLAAQIGLPGGMSGGGESPAFYADVIESRSLLRSAVTARFPAAGTDSAGIAGQTLVELFDVDGGSQAERERRAAKILDEHITVSVDVTTGLVTVRTIADSPQLAVALNDRLLELLNEFNQKRRQSDAASERAFAESRLASAQQELYAAEAALARFLEGNRRFQDSPELSFEAARLQRRVDLQQQVYVTLAQAAEEAGIEEVRNTPVITVVDRGADSVEPSGLGPAVLTLLALFIGAFLFIGLAFVLEFLAYQTKDQAEEYEEFVRLRDTILENAPIARLRRRA